MPKLSKIVFCLLMFLAVSQAFSALSLNFQNNFGVTAVDVSESIGWPEAVGGGNGLVDWDQFNYRGLIQFLFPKNDNLAFGAELGFHRLYYWERRYTPFGFSPQFYWGDLWTWSLGGLFRYESNAHFFFTTGFALHTFNNGTGTTVGIPAALGYDIPLSSVFTIPLEFRTDVIFGDATPIGLGGGLGLMFAF